MVDAAINAFDFDLKEVDKDVLQLLINNMVAAQDAKTLLTLANEGIELFVKYKFY